MPHQTILRLQHKVILIGKSQELTLHASSLQNIKSSQSLRNANPVVFGVVDDQLRGGPVGEVLCGVPAAPGGGGGLGEGVRWGVCGGGGGGVAGTGIFGVIPGCST